MDSSRDVDVDALGLFADLSGLALEADDEEEFLRATARALQRYTAADAVVLRLFRQQILTWVMAAGDGGPVLLSDQRWEKIGRASCRERVEVRAVVGAGENTRPRMPRGQ